MTLRVHGSYLRAYGVSSGRDVDRSVILLYRLALIVVNWGHDAAT
jgi:hypothetical protein